MLKNAAVIALLTILAASGLLKMLDCADAVGVVLLMPMCRRMVVDAVLPLIQGRVSAEPVHSVRAGCLIILGQSS